MKILVFQFLFGSFVMHGQSTSTLPVRFFNLVSIETLPILQKMAMRLQLWCDVNNWKKRLFFLKDYGSYLYWNPRLQKRTNILMYKFSILSLTEKLSANGISYITFLTYYQKQFANKLSNSRLSRPSLSQLFEWGYHYYYYYYYIILLFE